MRRTFLCAVVLSSLVAAALSAAADEIEPKRHRKHWCAVTLPVEHLQLRDGRGFYRGPGNLNDRYPFFLAANATERAAGFGYQLRLSNAHQLFLAIETEAAARELARIFTGGLIVPDEATYNRLRAEAMRLAPLCRGWGVKLEDGKPGCFGVEVKKTADGFTVCALVFKCSSYHRLEVVEQSWTLPTSGAIGCGTKTWIVGPPQAWQTSGDVDMAAERRLRGEVTRFRAAFLRILAGDRTLAAVRAALAGKPTFAVIRARLGEPDRELTRDWKRPELAYALADGTAVVFALAHPDGEDLPPLVVRHVASLVVREDGTPKVGRTLTELADASDRG